MLAEYFEKFTAPWPTPFFLVTADGVIVDVNPAGTRMLGSGRGKLIGTKLFDLLEDPPVTVENYLKSCSVRRAATACTLNWRNSEERSVTAQCTGFLFERKEDRESSLVILYCCLTDDFNDRLNGFRAEEAVSVFHEFLGQEEISGLDQFYDDEKPAADDLNCQFALNQAVAELSRQLIGAEENLSEMAELVLAKAREFTRSRRGFVSMIDHKSGDNVVYLPGVNTINNPVIKAPEIENIISAGDTGDYLGLWGRALNSGTSFFDNAVGRGKGSEKEFLGGAAIEKMLAVPVRYSGKLMGLIALANSRRDYNEDDLFAIERLADLYALAINRYWSREKRRELEEQLIEAQKMESIRTLAGGIAHDFNNILGIILGYADMARTDVSEDSRVAGDLDHIIKAGYRARDLVKQILTFSRQRGRALVPMQPATIVKEAIKMVRSSIPATIKIHQDIDPRCAKIMADYSQIHQIFLNLCTNAYHAMEKTGGDLYVTLRNSDYMGQHFPKELGVRKGPLVELIVRDTGHGIDDSLKERIFDPYFTTKEQGKGTGMGLAVIHGIVKSYGGAIKVESEPGEGASFHIFIPVIDEDSGSESEEDQSHVPGGSEHVLLVDDEAFLLDMGTDMLHSLGYSVTVRKGGFEAFELFKEKPDQFDLVLTDQSMPGMTGMELAIRLLEIRPELPVIICSGYADEMLEEEVKSLGIRDYIVKPFDKKDMAVFLRKALESPVSH